MSYHYVLKKIQISGAVDNRFQVHVEKKLAQKQKKIVKGQFLLYTLPNTLEQPMGVYLEVLLKTTVLVPTLIQ